MAAAAGEVERERLGALLGGAVEAADRGAQARRARRCQNGASVSTASSGSAVGQRRDPHLVDGLAARGEAVDQQPASSLGPSTGAGAVHAHLGSDAAAASNTRTGGGAATATSTATGAGAEDSAARNCS